ncbi:hypothetical protein DW089_06655 [Acidaminococcus sp. AM05-11]|nr:hypothetical protein DW089_06655 [Acidaminococcus sp. AM05-11]
MAAVILRLRLTFGPAKQSGTTDHRLCRRGFFFYTLTGLVPSEFIFSGGAGIEKMAFASLLRGNPLL